MYAAGLLLSASNVTLSGNTAGTIGGAVAFNSIGHLLNNATIVGNHANEDGGGLYASSNNAVTLKNSILASNTKGLVPIAQNSNVIQSSAGYNIATDGSAGLTQPTDRPTTTAAALRLDSLAANGGFALTHALQTGSPGVRFRRQVPRPAAAAHRAPAPPRDAPGPPWRVERPQRAFRGPTCDRGGRQRPPQPLHRLRRTPTP